MEIKQLKYFIQVAEMGSFSRAAAYLSIAQPALSRQIRNLEADLDVTLLYRNGRGVSMTEAGEMLLGRAKTILEDLQKTEQEIGALSGTATGSATLGVPPTVSQVLITPLIKRFREFYPAVSLQVVEGFSGHVNEWLVSGRLDVAVLYNAPRTKQLATERLLDEDLFLIAPLSWRADDSDTVNLCDLAGVPLILPSRPHGLRVLVDAVAGQAGVTLRVDFEIDALPAIKELVGEGEVATILPFASVFQEIRDAKMYARRIINPPFSRTLVLATSTRRPLSLAAKALLEQMKAVVKDLVDSGAWQGTS